MTDVFISYCRRDKAFVRALCHALQTNGHQLWVDWEGIQASEPWREEISKGIRNAKRMVYILSPDTVASIYCDWEVDQAFQLQKKLIPILCRDVDISSVRQDVSDLQFISFCGEDDFPTALKKLEGAITADLDYDRTFARLAQRAQEWQKRDRQDGWLRGAELEEAELWLASSTDKTPPPSQLQRDYILASRQERQAELERWQTLYEQSETRRIAAERNEITAFCKSSDAFFALDRPLDALIEALRAGIRLQQSDWSKDTAKLEAQVIGTLQQGLYWVRECNRLEGHNGTVRSVSISADGDRIVTASRDTTIRLWKGNGECLAVLQDHIRLVHTVAFAPDGQSFISGSWDSTIRIWSREGDRIKVLTDHGDRVLHIAFDPDGSCFASASSDGTVKLWTTAGDLLTSLDLGGIEQRCLAFSKDGHTLASGDRDGQIHIWKIDSDKTLTPLLSQAISAQPLNTLCFTQDHRWLFVGGVDGWIWAWDCDRRQLHQCVNQQAEIRAIQQIPNQHQLVSAGNTGVLSIWHLNSIQPNDLLQKNTTLVGHSGPILGLDIDSTGQLLLSAGGERVVRLWQWQSPQLKCCTTGEIGSYGLNFNAASDQILVLGENDQRDSLMQFWHRGGSLMQEWTIPASDVRNFGTSPQADLIATAHFDGSIKLWTAEGQFQAELTVHQDWVRQICFSPDGSLLTSASDDGTVCVWNRQGQLRQQIVRDDRECVKCVCFAPDGQSVIAGAGKRLMHWSLDGTLLNTFKGHLDEVLTVAFSPDGMSVISGGDDRTTRIWRLDGTLVHTLACQRSVRSVDVSPDGRAIAAGCRDGNIRFWSMDGLLLSMIQTRSGQIIRVCFSPDGQYLAATGNKGMLTIWHLDRFDEHLLDRLVDKGLDWCNDYLKTNSNGQTYSLQPS
ncbi:MAG: TIR domain-containing protein [Cyanobacteria bacterium P01_F01_bin.150]